MKSIIFDLDGTLYVSGKLRSIREKAILNALGDRASEYEKLRVSNSTIASLEKAGISRKMFFEIMEGVSIDLEKEEGLKKSLENLKKEYRLVVLSNSSRKCVEDTLEKLGVIDLIDGIYGGDEFGDKKPHEGCFFMVGPGDIAVGNNFEKDLEVPKGKGARTILISSKENLKSDVTISSISEIEDAVRRLDHL